jgi:hypothetical protein
LQAGDDSLRLPFHAHKLTVGPATRNLLLRCTQIASCLDSQSLAISKDQESQQAHDEDM